jgi:hypothetical protein
MIQARRLVILLTARQASVLDWRPGNLDWLGDFAASGDGVTAFARLMMQHARRPARVILDSVDEDYRMEILPHVAGAARHEMLARKLRQVFRNAAFTGAWRQGRETGGRRDDRYLIAAVNDADWLKPWLGAIDQAQLALEGITLLAMACQSLLHGLRVREPHTLLAYRLGSGLRLSYYQDGLLRFSRLLAVDTNAQAAGWAAEEISKTQLYLMGQRILPREARLHVLLLDPGGGLADAAAPLNADPAFNARNLDLQTLARALHVPDAFLGSAPDIAPLAAIASEPLLLNLAPAGLTRRHTDYRWRRAIQLGTLAIAVAGVMFTGAQWLRTLDTDDATRQLNSEQQQLEARYEAITRTFPAAPVSAEQLGQTIALAARIERERASPQAAMVALGPRRPARDHDQGAALAGSQPRHACRSGRASGRDRRRTGGFRRQLPAGDGSHRRPDRGAAQNAGHDRSRARQKSDQYAIERGPVGQYARQQRRIVERVQRESAPAGDAMNALASTTSGRQTRLPWSAIKTPLLLLVLVACAVAGGVWWSTGTLMRADAAYRMQRQARLAAERQLQRSSTEKQLIARYLGGYRALAERGFVGPENRLAWLEAVQQANRDAALYGLDYTLAPRTAAPAALAGGLPLGQTAMTLRMPLLVESDLLRFLNALQARTSSVYRIRTCRISRLSDTPPQAVNTPELEAECELLWYTVAPLAKAAS